MNLKKMPLEKVLLMINYFLGVTMTFFNTTMVPVPIVIQKVLILVMIGLFGCIFLLHIPQKGMIHYIFLAILLLLLLTNYWKAMKMGDMYSSDYEVILTVLFIFLIDINDVRTYIFESFILKITYLIVTIFSYVAGLSVDKILYSTTGAVRHAYGFSSPNGLGVILLLLSIEVIILFWNYRIMAVTVASLINGIGYLFAKSRTAVISFILFLAVIMIVKLIMNKYNNQKILMISPTVVLFIGFLYELFYTNNTFWNKLNMAFSNRLQMGKYYTDMYHLSLIGKPITVREYTLRGLVLNNGATYLVDSAYTRLILQWGIIAAIVVSIYILVKLYAYSKEKNYLYYSLISMILIYGFSERVAYNVFLFSPLLILAMNTRKLKVEK